MHRIKKHTRFAGLILLSGLFLLPTVFAQSTGGVKGKVRNLRGDGVPGAKVAARQNHTDIKTVTANNKGDFLLEGLEPGMYDFAIDAQGYGLGVMYRVKVKKGEIRDMGSHLMLSPDRGSQVFVRGIIFYRNKTSIDGAKVDLLAVNSDGSTRKIASGFTNELGEFGFVQPQGTKKYRVRASFKGVTGEKDVEIDMPAIYRVTIALELDRETK